jgi:hypothetical protein
MNIRRLLLDVDKAFARPSVLEIAQAIDGCTGVEAVNITVGEIDMETVDLRCPSRLRISNVAGGRIKTLLT